MDSPGKRILRWREHLGISTKQLADATDIPYSTLKTLENNTDPSKAKPSFDVIVKLRNSYPQLNIDWLFDEGGNEPMLRDGRALSQLPPPVPSKHEEANEPRPGYFKVTADSEELKQVKDERDYLREQNRRLLDLLGNAASFARPTGTGGKEIASADAAAHYALANRIFVDGLVRYPETSEVEEEHEAAHYSIEGERLAA